MTMKNYVEAFPPPFDKTPEKEFRELHEEETKTLADLVVEVLSIYLEQPIAKKRKGMQASIPFPPPQPPSIQTQAMAV